MKILFTTMLFISMMISISANSWLGMWLGLEMNLLSFIPLMNTNKNLLSHESSIKYFIVQSIASTIILFTIINLMMKTNLLWSMNQEQLIMMMNSSLLTKMGMAPFHFWFPEVMEGLSWINCLFMLTSQKIAPMILLMYNMNQTIFFSVIIIMSMIVSGIMGMNQISLRKILAYSSINHMGWMISMMMMMKTIWLIYFIIYSLISTNLVLIFIEWNINFLNQLYQSMNYNNSVKLIFILNFLSLSGMPPFLGFLPKWLTIQTLMMNNFILLPTLMIIFTLMTIYIYMRITISTIMMNSNEQNWNINLSINYFKKSMINIINFFSIWSLIIITMMFNMT